MINAKQLFSGMRTVTSAFRLFTMTEGMSLGGAGIQGADATVRGQNRSFMAGFSGTSPVIGLDRLCRLPHFSRRNRSGTVTAGREGAEQ